MPVDKPVNAAEAGTDRQDQLPEVDARLDAPAFHRNNGPIRGVLKRFLKQRSGNVLEIGSGTGQHVAAFAQALPNLTWWPTDPSDQHRLSIDAWRRHRGMENVRPAMPLDASHADWLSSAAGLSPTDELAAIVCINVLHISPWRVSEGVIAGASRYLGAQGYLFIYGPFARNGRHTALSNAQFDASLRAQNPAWGVRDTAKIEALAAGWGMRVVDSVEMPANNLTLVLRPTHPTQRV